MSAVVMGCFVPDFPHFLFLPARISFTHTVAGMFVVDLPAALAMLWLFHEFMKQPLLMVLPSGARRRLTNSVHGFPFRPSRRLALIVLSILTGTATHLVWDAFTHGNSWVSERWAILQEWVRLPAIGRMQICDLLEYASSLFGAAVVVVWIWYWYRTTTPSAEPTVQRVGRGYSRIVGTALPVAALMGGALWSWHAHGFHLHIRPFVRFTSDMVIAATTFFLLGLLAWGAMLRCFRRVPVTSSAA